LYREISFGFLLFAEFTPGLLPSYSRFVQWREEDIEVEEEVVMVVGTVVVEEEDM
jgi:hypothetical protein